MSPDNSRTVYFAACIFWRVALSALLLTGAYKLAKVPDLDALTPSLLTKDKQVDTLLFNANRAVQEVTSLTRTVRDGYDDTYYDQKAIIESTAALVRQAHETLRVTTNEVQITGRDARAMLSNAAASLQESSVDARRLIPAAEKVLNNIATLSASADAQLNKTSPEAVKTLLALNKALDDLDKLIANPDNAAVLANVEGVTHNLDESTKSVEIALRPLREKAGVLKTVLRYALGVFKVTLPLP